MVIRLLQPALRYFQIYGRWLRSTVGKWKVPQNLACSSLLQISWKNWLSRRLTIDLLQTIGSIWRLSFRFFFLFIMTLITDVGCGSLIAWMYCVGEGRGSCEVATMSKSLPVASLFCWFCKYEVHELVYFLTFRKKWNYVLFCFVLLVTEVKVFYLNDPPFCFWYRNIDMSNFCVGLVGGGWDGWCELRSEPRAAHVFFIFQIKKELFIFIFQIKSISKGTFWKKEQNGKVW